MNTSVNKDDGKETNAAEAGRTPSPANGPAVYGGVVETYKRREFSGWVAVPYDVEKVRVTLNVNDVEVAATWASKVLSRKADGNVVQFRFALYDFWKYVKRADKVTIQADGTPLAIPAKGYYFNPRTDGEFDTKYLQAKIDKGYIFGQSGRLQLSKSQDVEWQDNVIGLYKRVNEVLAERDHRSFMVYGTLLGAVREKGFIGHDLDFDAAYVSKYSTGKKAAEELIELAFLLIDRGFKVVGKRTCLAISDKESDDLKIDLFHLYFDEKGKINFPFGVASDTSFGRDQFGELVETPMGRHSCLAPANSEGLVAHIYGENWRTPDPGFNWKRDRRQGSRDGILTEAQVEEIYWADFYSRTTYTTGSTFAHAILSRDDLPKSGVEFGCGDGRDVFAFGKAGHQVIGLDRSHVGTRHASDHAKKLGLDDRVSFRQCDVNDREQVSAIITEARARNNGGALLFYSRFFLHSIVDSTQEILLTVIGDLSREGDYFAAEFRTNRDESNKKVHEKHYRRFQDPRVLVKDLEERYGFDVILQQQGTGFSPYKGENPDLARIVGVRRK